jgi:hypothetical protein
MQDELLKQQIEVMLQMHAKKMVNEMQSMREELSQTKAELLRAVQSGARVSAPSPAPAVSAPQMPQAAPQPAAPAHAGFQPQPQAAAPAEPAPAEASVDLEKIFYAGR